MWRAVWDGNPYGVATHRDLQWKLLHRPRAKHMQWLCKPATCMHPDCVARLPDPQARGLHHFLSDCRVSGSVWEWLSGVWEGVIGRPVDLSSPHCFTGTPSYPGVPLGQMDSPVWRALHSTTLYHLWCAWTAWAHEETPPHPPDICAGVIASLGSRMPVLLRQARLPDRGGAQCRWSHEEFTRQWSQEGCLATMGDDGILRAHIPTHGQTIQAPRPGSPEPMTRRPGRTSRPSRAETGIPWDTG